MQLIVGFIPINTQQQNASLSFKPGVLERKVYNNDDETFLRGSGCNTLSHSGLTNVNKRKRMFYPLNNMIFVSFSFQKPKV